MMTAEFKVYHLRWTIWAFSILISFTIGEQLAAAMVYFICIKTYTVIPNLGFSQCIWRENEKWVAFMPLVFLVFNEKKYIDVMGILKVLRQLSTCMYKNSIIKFRGCRSHCKFILLFLIKNKRLGFFSIY